MNNLMWAGVISLVLAGSAVAQGLNTTGAAADYPRRLQLAQEYMRLNPVRNALQNSVGGLDQSGSLKATFDALDYRLLDRQGAELMAETFTAAEIAALVEFQKSPVGQRIVLKMPLYQQIMGSKVQNELRRAYELTLNPASLLGLGTAPRPASPTAPARPAAPPNVPSLGQGTPIRR